MQPIDACPACLGRDSKPFTIHDGIALVRCGGCGVIHMNTMPSPAQLAGIYNDAYDGATTSYFAKADAKMRRSRHRVRQLRRHVDGGRLLDIGCNGGFMVEAARTHGFEAHGVELDPVSVAYALRALHQVARLQYSRAGGAARQALDRALQAALLSMR